MYTIVEFVQTHPDAVLPKFTTAGAAGMDLTYVGDTQVMAPGQRVLLDCGFKISVMSGYEAQVRPRSGLAVKYGVTVLNSPGTIDSDYRGDLKVLLVNHGDSYFHVNSGMRIAQLVVKPVCAQVACKLVSEFSDNDTERGENGFGSTGL